MVKLKRLFNWAKLKTVIRIFQWKEFNWYWIRIILAWITELYSTDQYEFDREGNLTKKLYMEIKKSKRSLIYKNDNLQMYL